MNPFKAAVKTRFGFPATANATTIITDRFRDIKLLIHSCCTI